MSDSDAAAIGRAGLLFLFATGLSMISGFLFRIILANNMTQSDFGAVMLALSIINILSIPACLGLDQGISKFYPESNNKQSAGHISFSILLVGFLSAIVALIIFLFSQEFKSSLFGNTVSNDFILLLLLMIPLFSLLKIIRGSLKGAMASKQFVTVTKLVQPGSRLMFAGSAALLFGSLIRVTAGVLLSFLLTMLIGFFFLYHIGWSFSITRGVNYRPLVRFSLPLLVSSSVYILLSRVDRLFLGYFRTTVEVSQYEVAFTIALLLSIFHSSFSFLILPKVSELSAEKQSTEIQQVYQQTTKWILTATTPALLIVILRPQIFIQLFGDNYSTSELYWPLFVLGITKSVDAVVGPNGDALLGLGKSRKVMVYNLISLIINLILNIILIPIYGVLGATIALFTGYVVMNTIKSYDLFVNHSISVVNRPGIKSSLSTVTFALPILLLTRSFHLVTELVFLGIVWTASIGVSIVVLHITGDLTDDDLCLLRNFIYRY